MEDEIAPESRKRRREDSSESSSNATANVDKSKRVRFAEGQEDGQNDEGHERYHQSDGERRRREVVDREGDELTGEEAEEADLRLRAAQEKGKGKSRGPSGRFEQKFKEDTDYGITKFSNTSDKLEFEEAENAIDDDDYTSDQGGIRTFKLKDGQEATLEPFNLNEERREGTFDEEGNYIFGKDDKDDSDNDNEGFEGAAKSDEYQADAWLDDAKYYGTKKTVTFAEGSKPEAEVFKKVDVGELMYEVTETLLPGETVARALSRLGAIMNAERKRKQAASGRGRGRGRGRGKQQEQQDTTKPDKGKDQGEDVEAVSKQFLYLTEIAGKLMNEGMTGIYDIPREKLKLQLDSRKNHGAAATTTPTTTTATTTTTSDTTQSATSGTTQAGDDIGWEYKTYVDGEGVKVFGPFDTNSMREWAQQGYLSEVLVRRAGSDAGFQPIAQASFMQQ